MANKHGDFIWYELLTPDQDGARLFYQTVVGWKIEDKASNPMDYRMIASAQGYVAGSLTLTPAMAEKGAQPLWLGYIAVDDVDKTVAHITASGGAVLMPAHDLAGVGRLTLVTDPQGVPFYLMKPASDGTSHAFEGDHPRAGHCGWNELTTTDQAAAMTFYTQQFGWVKDGEMDMGPMGMYEFLRHGPIIGAMMTTSPYGPRAMWSYYFRVDDIDAAATKITACGGQIIHGPAAVPGNEWIIKAIDPQGAHFALVGHRL